MPVFKLHSKIFWLEGPAKWKERMPHGAMREDKGLQARVPGTPKVLPRPVHPDLPLVRGVVTLALSAPSSGPQSPSSEYPFSAPENSFRAAEPNRPPPNTHRTPLARIRGRLPRRLLRSRGPGPWASSRAPAAAVEDSPGASGKPGSQAGLREALPGFPAADVFSVSKSSRRAEKRCSV